jgi:hypothetical protein
MGRAQGEFGGVGTEQAVEHVPPRAVFDQQVGAAQLSEQYPCLGCGMAGISGILIPRMNDNPTASIARLFAAEIIPRPQHRGRERSPRQP